MYFLKAYLIALNKVPSYYDLVLGWSKHPEWSCPHIGLCSFVDSFASINFFNLIELCTVASASSVSMGPATSIPPQLGHYSSLTGSKL